MCNFWKKNKVQPSHGRKDTRLEGNEITPRVDSKKDSKDDKEESKKALKQISDYEGLNFNLPAQPMTQLMM